ncbi:MAG: hypothetical protein AAB116_20110, partial [Candidatus Poribacteria bacterium]
GIDECKENIKEAIEIYLEDIPEGQGIFKPSPLQYWQMFYELRYRNEQEDNIEFTHNEKRAIEELLESHSDKILQYA